MGVIEDRYQGLLRRLFPSGKAWSFSPVSKLENLISGFAIELARIETRSTDLRNEADPRTAFESLADWERIVGLPDACQSGVAIDTNQRRSDIVRKLTARGGQSPAYFIALAASFGYVITIIKYPSFRAGQNRCGDPIWGISWAFHWGVVIPQETQILFRAGQSSAGTPLGVTRVGYMECEIQDNAPANSVVCFSWG